MNNYMKTIISGLKQWVSSQKSDWNQNDSSAANFIKNRPFYSEEKERVLFSSDSLSSQEFTLPQPLVEGATYTVIFNGVTYQCLAKEYDGYIMIGNNAIYEYDNGVETDTGEPFAIEYEVNSTNAYLYTDDTITEAPSVSISGTVEVVHQIDKKYVPIPELANVAFSGDYWDLENTPYIPWDVVQYNETQYLNDDQKLTARNNIEAASATDVSDLSALVGDTAVSTQIENATSKFATNLSDGTNVGSLRGISAKKEEFGYYLGENSVSFGDNTSASGNNSFSYGGSTYASGPNSCAGGTLCSATGGNSRANGYDTEALGSNSSAEGYRVFACGESSHAEGRGEWIQIYIHEETGENTYLISQPSMDKIFLYGYLEKDGVQYVIIGKDDVNKTITLDKPLSNWNMTEMFYYGASYGNYSHSEGNHSLANGEASHSEGYFTSALSDYQHVQGKYNVADSSNKYAHIVGNGTSDTARSNAHTLDWDGNAWFAGKIYVGGTYQDDAAAVEVALKSDLASLSAPTAISLTRIDEICNQTIYSTNEVTF